MKTRFSFLWLVILACQVLVAQTHIKVKDPSTWTTDELTPYVNQEVIFDAPIYVTSNASSGSYIVSTRRLFTPTNQVLPKFTNTKATQAYNAFVSMNAAGAITLTNVSAYHRCGEKIDNLHAKVLSKNELRFISGKWDSEYNTRAYWDTVNVRRLVNIDGCDTCLLVCTANLENYFINDNNHANHRAKVIDALTHIEADLFGFVEIECGDAAVKEIVTYLNNKFSPRRKYAYVADGTSASGTDTKAAFIYDSKLLKPYGELQVIGTGVGKARKEMQVFEQKSNGERFIYSVNHFKAKTSGGTGKDADQKDGQGNYNAARCEEAQAVLDLYVRISPQLQEKDILIMGDLNSYAKEDPIRKFLDYGLIDLHRAFHADASYSYQYDHLAGYLDHAICSESLRPQVCGAIGFHCNSDEQRGKKTADQTMFRYSDHDPVLVGLRLDKSATYDPQPLINNLEVLRGNANKLIIRDALTAGGQDSYYGIYDVSGRPIVSATRIESSAEEVELPTAAGVYILYVYFETRVYPYKFIVP